MAGVGGREIRMTLVASVEIVLFDVGGVLMADAIDDKLAALALRYGLSLPRLLAHKVELRPRADLGELSDPEFWTRLLEREGVEADGDDLDLRPYLAAVPGTLELARELASAGIRVAILSNDSTELARTRRQAFGLDELFDPVLISSALGLIKPDPAIYRLAIARLGAPAERIAFVDNTPANVQAAIDCGLRGLVFTGADALRAALADLGLSSPGAGGGSP